ncbi:MAG TPA: helical backbone metal receptor [Bacteroidia bacterium]|jgi:ABC-type Fe3+-hydroxamate transport system substrate-binding protein|nr:helical backbone metal receptor [Bacteroidia bacterium]
MKKSFIDQMGRDVSIEWPPKRIISLVPSQTELLYSLGLNEEVVGVTKFCVHPEEWFRSKQRIGGTKKLDFDKIAALKPDLIIGNKEENEESQIKQLMQQYPVWMSDIHNLEDAFEMMSGVGEVINLYERAIELVKNVKAAFEKLKATQLHTAAYFIWREPFMVAGGDTFLNNMLNHCGLKNVFENHKGRYPELNKEEIKKCNPEVILLSSEPYPFSAKHVSEFQQISPSAKIVLVDGEYFSWYGPRLLRAPDYFLKVLSEI